MNTDKNKITITILPSWLPPAFRNLPLAERQFRVQFTAAERQVYRKRQPIMPSKWAERHRHVTSGPLEGGKWSNYLTPYLAGIVDASFFPSVRLIINCKAVQVGGTTAIETCLGYAVDRRPGPALVVYPDRDTARENNRDNLQPMIKASPRLRSYLTGVDDDIATLRIKLTTMLLYMGWSGSATSLGNKSVKYLVLDEIDKYTETPNKKEAASIDLAEKRTTAYPHDYKEWKNSTPTVESGPIWRALTTEAQVIFEFWGKCPDCGSMQLIRFGNKDQSGETIPGGIRWPEGEEDYEKIETEGLAWYECEHCGSHWSDHQRNRAVRHGEWRAKGGLVQSLLGSDGESVQSPLGPDGSGRELFAYLHAHRPKKIGFHLPAWISPFVSISKSAAAFVRGQKDHTARKDFLNNYAAEPWVDEGHQSRQEDFILRLVDPALPRGVVPRDVSTLLLLVDTQAIGFHYQVVAYGYGRDLETWRIDHGFVEHFDHLLGIFNRDYHDAEGARYPVQAAFIDSGGGTNPFKPKHSRTAEVYEFCRRNPMFHPLKGRQTMAQGWNTTRLDFYPSRTGQKIPIPGGLVLYTINTGLYKDNLAGKLQVEPVDPGAWHLHAEIGEDFARQMCAEYKDERGHWQCPRGKDNHHWDISVYALVAADIMGIKDYRQQTEERQQIRPNRQQRTSRW